CTRGPMTTEAITDYYGLDSW
nr:immunoglobulin heavy chain junction region [Macaca mulatta]